MSLTDDEIDAIAKLLNGWPSNGKPETQNDIFQKARALGYVEEHTQEKACKACGTPRVDYRYWKITPSGRVFLRIVKRELVL